MPPLVVGGVAGPHHGGAQDRHNFDMANQYQMVFSNAPQANPFSQPRNHALQDAWVRSQHQEIPSFGCLANAHSLMCIPPQVPPAPANGQPEGPREDIPPPVGHVAGPRGVQDQYNFDMPYQGGVVDYHPRPLVDVSDSHLVSATEPPLIHDTRAIESCICIPRCRTRPRHPGTCRIQCSGGCQSIFPRYVSKPFCRR